MARPKLAPGEKGNYNVVEPSSYGARHENSLGRRNEQQNRQKLRLKKHPRKLRNVPLERAKLWAL